MSLSRVRQIEQESPRALLDHYHWVRQFTHHLCDPLETEDYVVQTMVDVSPTKWHIAHTSWFFETFLLAPHLPGYKPFHPRYAYLFNSYYNSVGEKHCRPRRGLLSRPTVSDIYEYRAWVDLGMQKLLDNCDQAKFEELRPIILLGINHEQQHQELILTDIKNVLAASPLYPEYSPEAALNAVVPDNPAQLGWVNLEGGIHSIGHEGSDFAFDNEGPRHRVLLHPYSLATRPVTCGEYLEFMESGGYSDPLLWLSDGWAKKEEDKWDAPYYWEKRSDGWHAMTLHGFRRIQPEEPVCHISYYEADAFARWAGARLPTEAEWEVASQSVPVEGNFVDDEVFHPVIAPAGPGLLQMFGNVWEYTSSAYNAYPGYRPAPGALGEYNGKFMCNQMVLRGGSCATAISHIRRTYRNFFHPHLRWQFAGLRLAKDAQ